MSFMPSRFLSMCSLSKWFSPFHPGTCFLRFRRMGASPISRDRCPAERWLWLQHPAIHCRFQERHNLYSGYRQQSDRLRREWCQQPGSHRNVRPDHPASAHPGCQRRSLRRRHSHQWYCKLGRIIELAGDGKGNLTGAATLVFSGAPLTNPIALTIDSAGTHVHRGLPAFRGMEPSIRWLWVVHTAAAECYRPQYSVHSGGVVEGLFEQPLHRRQWQLHGKQRWRIHRDRHRRSRPTGGHRVFYHQSAFRSDV